MFLFSTNKYPKVEMLGPMTVLFFVFWEEISILCSILAAPICSPTSSAQGALSSTFLPAVAVPTCFCSRRSRGCKVRPPCFFFFFFKDFVYLHLERRERKEKKREEIISVWEIALDRLPLAGPQLGTQPTTQARALTRNWPNNPLVGRPALNPLSHTSQG